MKTAIYIEDGILQIVLTPETEFEQNVMKQIERMDRKQIQVTHGSFYGCNGGWIRHNPYTEDDDSLILVAIKEKP